MVMNTPYVLPKLGIAPTLSDAIDANKVLVVVVVATTSNANDKEQVRTSENKSGLTQSNAGLGGHCDN